MRPRTGRTAVGVAVLVYVVAILSTLSYAWVHLEAPLVASLFVLTVVGAVAALVGLWYFLRRGRRTDGPIGESEFTWAVAIVLLCLHGVAPGLIAAGLYAVVERDAPVQWLFASLVAGLVVVALAAAAVSLEIGVLELAAVAPL